MPNKKDLNILIVEDELEIREAFQQFLISDISQYLGTRALNITLSADGVDAHAKIQNQEFALVITDQMMPRKDGLGLIRSVLHDASIREKPPFIYVSGAFEPEKVKEALALGVKNILAKPVNRQRFTEEVKKALNFH